MYHPSVDCFSLTGIIIEVKKKRLLTFGNLIAPYAMKSCPLVAAVTQGLALSIGICCHQPQLMQSDESVVSNMTTREPKGEAIRVHR